jgi:hypothetical protein
MYRDEQIEDIVQWRIWIAHDIISFPQVHIIIIIIIIQCC